MRVNAVLILAAVAWAFPAAADISVRDGSARIVTLAQPAQRIVSLAPHVTETIYAAGAGERLVGAVQFSDFPVAARAVPRVGGFASLDLEAITALRPDLIVAWLSGNSAAQLERLEQLGFVVYRSQPKQVDDVATDIENVGMLAGNGAAGRKAAAAFRAKVKALRTRYAGRRDLRVFYEVWNQPLLTVSDAHIIGDVITACGGHNVFGGLPLAAAPVDVEAVLQADPDVIVASGMAGERPEWLDAWRAWPHLRAVQWNHLYSIPPDILQRAGPRIVDGIDAMCRVLERARQP